MGERSELSADELAAEDVVALPDKEVVSILDLNADLDLAIDAASPIDLGVAANANVAAPIDAAVGANILSVGSTAQALSDQGVIINQSIEADAVANAQQDSTLEQGASPDGAGTDTDGTATGTTGDGVTAAETLPETGGTVPDTGDALPDTGTTLPDAGATVGDLADGDLRNVDVDLAADANIAAPINGAIAANANVAAPIDAAVAANVGSVDSTAVAVCQQDAIINQSVTGSAEATAGQQSDISQPDGGTGSQG